MRHFWSQVSNNTNETLYLPYATSSILGRVLEWIVYHEDDSVACPHYEVGTLQYISPWDAAFINVDLSTLLDLFVVAYFLEIKGLLDLLSIVMIQ
ncbi:hypothetical protein GWI33_005191 [Rhynchophorus ferrugineus]|uniref:Uncharacterized protein n=1 Tax=Rhynchophorus ferrugineus TaxID=354439 RepID=A0A834INJ0_RHYFE|nr:hypothetical protein GWI33_005191 [Rhynchophorus ferrugineus]